MIDKLLRPAFRAQGLAQFLDGGRKERASDRAAVRTGYHPGTEALHQPALRPEGQPVVSADDEPPPAADWTLLPDEVHDASLASGRRGCKQNGFSILDLVGATRPGENREPGIHAPWLEIRMKTLAISRGSGVYVR